MATVRIPSEPLPLSPAVFVRFALSILGAAFVLAAFMVWLVPTAQGLPQVSLIKMGLSSGTLIAGLCCLVLAREAGMRG